MFPVPARARRLWLAAAASLSFIPTALAQSSTALETITIEAGQQPQGPPASLTVPTPEQARTEIQRTPGGVAIVRSEDFRTTTPAATIKDVLDYVPGVF